MDRVSMDRGSMDRGSMDRGSMDRGSMDRVSMDMSGFLDTAGIWMLVKLIINAHLNLIDSLKIKSNDGIGHTNHNTCLYSSLM
jgi:hypothetical protein